MHKHASKMLAVMRHARACPPSHHIHSTQAQACHSMTVAGSGMGMRTTHQPCNPAASMKSLAIFPGRRAAERLLWRGPRPRFRHGCPTGCSPARGPGPRRGSRGAKRRTGRGMPAQTRASAPLPPAPVDLRPLPPQ